MKPTIVKFDIVDNDFDPRYCESKILRTYYLINPDKAKLFELCHMIEYRHNWDGLTDEEIEAREEFCDFIWDKVDEFINENFVVFELKIGEFWEAQY